MMVFRTVLLVAPAACLLAQNPAPQSAAPPAHPTVEASPKPVVPPPPAVPADRVVLSVGDFQLTAAQFDELVSGLSEQARNAARGPAKRQFAENIIQVFVLAEEGKKRKIDATPTYRAQEQFQAANLLAARTFGVIGEGLNIDDAGLQKYYDEHKREFEQVRARHILIRASGSPQPLAPGQKELSDQEALAKAQSIRKQLVDGTDFAALATAESDDTGSKAKGGELNFFHRGQMVPQFEEAAFAMNVGEISQPVKTQFGYHIIQVEAKKGFEEAKPEIEQKVRNELARKALEEMEKNAKVVLDPQFFGNPSTPNAAAPATPVK